MKEELDQLPERIVGAYKGKGLRARPYSFVPSGGCCCGLGALLAGEHPLDSSMGFYEIGNLLGWDQEAVYKFTLGFDVGLTELPRKPQPTFDNLWTETGYRTALRVVEEGLVDQVWYAREVLTLGDSGNEP